MKTVRTRIPPSPTGENLHIGNVYAALINYVFAKKHNGQFIVRIEDTDRTRFVEGSEDRILDSLEWLGIAPDESTRLGGPFAPYRQSDRLAFYQKYAQELVEKGNAYYCFCTPEQLVQMKEVQKTAGKIPHYDGRCLKLSKDDIAAKLTAKQPHVIRLKVPDTGTTTYHDVIRGDISFENALIDDQVLLKSDGFPTYHLGVVIDDHLMEISHVIRAEEWISSMPKQLLLYKYLGWDAPEFAHLPLLRNPDKSKLSKRKNPVWVSWYRAQGYMPQAILNYLGTVGWAVPEKILERNRKAGTAEELFSMQDMMEYFELSQIQTTAPTFDLVKLQWFNGEYIRKTQNSELKTQIYEFFNKKYDEKKIEQILPLAKERIKTLKEFESLAGFFFAPPDSFETEINKQWMQSLVQIYTDSAWDHENLLAQSRAAAEKLGVPFRKLAMDLRVAVTGKTVGPPLFESLELLGKEETLARLTKISS